MRSYRIPSAVTLGILLVTSAVLIDRAVVAAQDGPVHQGSDGVAKPRTAPADSSGTVNAPADQTPIPSKLKPKDRKDEEGSANFRVEANLVSIDVAVVDNRGNFIPNIPKNAFRILEDDVPQQIRSFNMGEAPMTIAMLIEFSAKFQRYASRPWYETLTASYDFVRTLKKEDYVAVIAFDLKPEILSDFSQDRNKTQEALGRLRIAGFSEINLFDALVDTEERMKDIEGRKAILLLASGIDTFSKFTFDKTRKVLQQDAVPVYAIGLYQAMRIMSNMRGSDEIEFLQADNEMKTFAKETGGQSYFPRFTGEFPSIFSAIEQSLRNQYSLGYSPTNTAKDGKFRKIKVQLVNSDGDPLRVNDQKGKPVKYQIIAKAGYNAPRAVE